MAAVNQLSGFQNKFVGSDSLKDYECPLCLHVTRDPSLTSCCGQHFCLACINRILSESKPCPLCKEKTFTIMLDKKQKRRVLDLQVYCEKKDVGCDWTGILGESEHHNEKNCIFVSVDCPNNCGSTIQRRILAEHQANDCPKRPHSCEHCQLTGSYQEIEEDHIPVCPKRPVMCRNECGITSLERDQLEQHEAECPLAMVECELKEVGCEEKVRRKDLDRHMEEAARKHIQLMTTYNVKTVTALKVENLELRKEVGDLKRELGSTALSLSFLRLDLGPTISQAAQATAYMKKNFIQIHLKNFSKLEGGGTRWENPEEFYTFPSRHKMKINLSFTWDRIEVELTLLTSQDEYLPNEMGMTLRMVNQKEIFTGHFEITRSLLMHYDMNDDYMNDDIYIKYSKIYSGGGGKYLADDSLRLQAHVWEL